MNAADVGNIYDRTERYDYLSAPFQIGSEARLHRLRWEAETPFRTKVEFQLRRAASREALETSSWQGPGGEGTYYKASGADLSGFMGAGAWLQYKATLISPDSANTPVLRGVFVEYR
jgi:hypothetical protein